MELIGALFVAAILIFAILKRNRRQNTPDRRGLHDGQPPAPAPLPGPPTPAPRPIDLLPPIQELHPVTRVVDGDTFHVEFHGQARQVRPIGIDTPETLHPNRPVEFYGPEASAEAKRLLQGNSVALFVDPSQGERDVYGRWLYYVVLPDGTDYCEHMVRQGFARVYRYKTDFAMMHKYLAAQDEAKAARRGIWSV